MRRVVSSIFLLSHAVLGVPVAAEIQELWLEYEDCTSEEAKVVKDFDKLEMIVQADEYERGQSGRVLWHTTMASEGILTQERMHHRDCTADRLVVCVFLGSGHF